MTTYNCRYHGTACEFPGVCINNERDCSPEGAALRACTRCAGTGVIVSEGFTSIEGKVYPTTERVCYACNGAKRFAPPYVALLELTITTARGAKDGKRRMRASMNSSKAHKEGHEAERAYYVWRIAAWHGSSKPGAQCMPVMADIAIGGDPFKAELDTLAEAMAKKYYGTDMRAVMLWGRALGAL